MTRPVHPDGDAAISPEVRRVRHPLQVRALAIAAVREVLVGHHGLAKGQVRASAYWRRGASAHHENLEG